ADAKPSSVLRVERMFGVNISRDAAGLLGLRDDMQRQCRLAARLRPVDFNDAATRHAADADGGIQAEARGGDGRHVYHLLFAESHDRAFAELLLDIGYCEVN